MVVVVKEIPAILRSVRQRQIFISYKALVEHNTDGPADLAELYAKFGLNILSQCSEKFHEVSLGTFISWLKWGSESPLQKWLACIDVTVGAMLQTQEFHKQVIDRMWNTWMTDGLRVFDPPKDIQVGCSLQARAARRCQTREEMLEIVRTVTDHARTYWLP